jgi:FAD:protein FMN transferase
MSSPAPHRLSVAKRLRPAMGTWVAIQATAGTEHRAVAGIDAAYRAIAELEWQLHPRRAGSDLERINSAALLTPVPIADSTWRVLKLAEAVHALSDGAFDPCLPSHPGRFSDLMLSPPGTDAPWALRRMPLTIDLGGIAKGYAVDRAIEALRAEGCTSGLVNAGGDLRVCGRSQSILLRHANGTCVPFTLSEQALAASDVDARQRPTEHRGYYLRSGVAFPAPRYAAVVAATAAVADALTKCVLLADAQCSTRTLRTLRARRVA